MLCLSYPCTYVYIPGALCTLAWHCIVYSNNSVLLLQLFFFPRLFSSPFFFSTPPSRHSAPGSHRRLFSPLPHYGSCLAFFIARRFQLFLTFVDSRRILLTHARRSQQLILILFLQINPKPQHVGIRAHGPTLLL